MALLHYPFGVPATDVGRSVSVSRTFHAWVVSLLIIVSGLAVLMVSSNAAALSVDYYGLVGYQGNSAIYLTTGVNTDPYVFPTIYNEAYQSTNNHGKPNAINVTAGQSPEPSSSTLVFNEQYNPASEELVVTIPIAAGGGSATYQCLICNPAYRSTVVLQTLRVDVSFASAGMHTDIQTSYNTGVNVTGQDGVGTTKDEALINLGIRTLSYLPQWGFVVGPYSLMKNLEDLSGVNAYSFGLTGNGNVYEVFKVTGGSPPFDQPWSGGGQNVFVSQTVVVFRIPQADFMSYVPRLDISAANTLGNYYRDWEGQEAGASAQLDQIKSAAAVTLTGTVYAAGSPLANHDITLSTYTEGPYVNINYHLKTDQDGKYRFFAEPNKPYTLSSSYSTSFGTALGQTSWTTLSTPDSQTKDLALPVSEINGYVTTSGGSPIGGASVTTTSPSGSIYTTSSNSNGYYSLTVKDQGSYAMTAASGTSSQTKSLSVTSLNTVYSVSFTLLPNFGLSSSCSYVSLLTGGDQRTCTITATSYVGFSGTVSLSVSVSPVVDGGPTVSVSPTSVTLAPNGQASATLTITSGTATGQFTITVSGVSGSLSQSTTILLEITPPGGGGGGGHCTPSHCPT